MRRAAWLMAAAGLLVACGDGGGDGSPGADTVGTDIHEDAADVAPDAPEDVPDDTDVSDGADTADLGPDVSPADADAAGDADATTRVLVQEKTGLGKDFVFKGVWAGEAGRAVAVGNDGVVVGRDPDGAWQVLQEGETADLLNAVTGTSAGDLWAVGKGGTVLRGGVGDLKCLEEACGPDGALPTLFGAWAAAPDDLWAVGLQGTIVHHDGEVGEAASGPDVTVRWHGMHGLAEGEAVLVGTEGRLARFVDGALISEETPTQVTLRSVASAGGGLWWAVGDAGTLLRGEGGVWTPVPVSTAANLHDVHAVSPFDAYAVGDGGIVLHWDGDLWTPVVDLPAGVAGTDLRAVYVDAEGEAVITGDGGATIQGTASGGFDLVGDLAPEGMLTAAWGGGGIVVLAGDHSTVFVHQDGEWTEQAVPTTQHIRGVWGSAADDVWAVGLAGLILHYDGEEWIKLDPPSGEAMETVWGSAADDVWAAGADGTVFHWDGVMWRSAISQTSKALRAVFVFPEGQGFAVGSDGTIMQGGGLAWRQVEIEPLETPDGEEVPVTDPLHGVWGASPDDVWAVGGSGRIVHWDGEAWTSKDPGFGITLRAVWGTAADDVWAVGGQGHVLHYDGEVWTPRESNSVATLYAVHGDGGDHVVIVGDLGTVLRVVEETPR
ncbi:MAG: hypothetical protein ACQEXJ_16050 [Myxococcota bacterium]